jgi:secreted Zn-dependent insulinase-like peptidase
LKNRTKKQLGYDVYCDPLVLSRVSGFSFHITSSHHNPARLQRDIDEFTKALVGFFEKEISDESFNTYKSSLMEKLMLAPSLKEESNRLWKEIVKKRCFILFFLILDFH